jgi:hypothetical protein
MRAMMAALSRLRLAALALLLAVAVTPASAEVVCESANPSNCYERQAVAARAPVASWASWNKAGWESAQAQCKRRGQFDRIEGTACWFIDMFMAQCQQAKIPDGVSRACQRGGLRPAMFSAFVSAVADNTQGIKECAVFVDAFSGFKLNAAVAANPRIKPKVDDFKKKLADLQTKFDAKFRVDSAAIANDMFDAYKHYDQLNGVIEAQKKLVEFASLMNKVGGLKSLWAHAGGVAQPKLAECLGQPDQLACIAAYSDSGQIVADVASSQALVEYMNSQGVIKCITATDAVFKTLK